MKVDANQLWQAVKNVSVFSRKDGWAGGVKVVGESLRLTFLASDDFVGISSFASYEGSDSGEFYLSHESIRELEKSLRDKEGEIEISLIENQLHLDPLVGSAQTIECPGENWWNMFTYVMDHVYTSPQPAHDWALDPQRLSKMNLLEPKAEYPLALGHCEIGGAEYVAFRYGPNTQGMIKPLDRGKLREAYKDRIDEVIW